MILYSFRETNRFTKRVERVMGEDDFAELQLTLAADPVQGVIVSGSGGHSQNALCGFGAWQTWWGQGDYYFPDDDAEIYLLDIYTKNEQSDLAKDELKELRAVVREWLSNTEV